MSLLQGALLPLGLGYYGGLLLGLTQGEALFMGTVRDVLRAKNIRSRKASSLAIAIPKLSPGDSVSRAARLTTDYRVRALPITDGDQIIGEITALSICKALHSTSKLDFFSIKEVSET